MRPSACNTSHSFCRGEILEHAHRDLNHQSNEIHPNEPRLASSNATRPYKAPLRYRNQDHLPCVRHDPITNVKGAFIPIANMEMIVSRERRPNFHSLSGRLLKLANRAMIVMSESVLTTISATFSLPFLAKEQLCMHDLFLSTSLSCDWHRVRVHEVALVHLTWMRASSGASNCLFSSLEGLGSLYLAMRRRT